MMSRHYLMLTACTTAAIVLCGVGPAFAADSFMSPLGQVAEAERAHLVRVVAVTMIAIVPVLIGVPLILWRYRRGRTGSTYRPEWDRSLPLEIVMWGVPFAIILALGIWLWQSTHQLDPYKALGPDPVRVQVVGLDWKWLFIYPDEGIASMGEMAVPVGRPVSLTLTTDTVMQSFFISALAGQIYAMPGMTTHLNLIADRPGDAEGENTQYNGNGFAHQKFKLRALPDSDWQDWVDKAAEAGLPLDANTYAQLAKRGSEADARRVLTPQQTGGPLLFNAVPANFFDGIVQRYHHGTAISAAQQPGAPDHNSEDQYD